MGTGLLIFIRIGLISFYEGVRERELSSSVPLVVSQYFYTMQFLSVWGDLLAYIRTILPFSIVNWWIGFYIGRSLSSNVLMKVIQCFLK